MMVRVALKTVIPGRAVGLMTGSADHFGRQNNIRRLCAAARLVTSGAIQVGMFGVIEAALIQPSFRHHRSGNDRHLRTAFYFMTISATWKKRAALVAQPTHVGCRSSSFIAVENFLLQLLSRSVLATHLSQAVSDESFNLGVCDDFFISHREVGVLLRQTAEESMNKRGVTVGNGQIRVLLVELQRMARLAVFGKCHVFIIDAAGTGLMTKRAVEFFAIEQCHFRIVADVRRVAEAERVGIFIISGMDLEFRVILREFMDDLRIAVGGTGCFEGDPAPIMLEVESARGHRFSIATRCQHDAFVAMTMDAVLGIRRGHGPRAAMFPVTYRAGKFPGNIRLMKIVGGMTFLAGCVDLRGFRRRLEKQLLPLLRRRVRHRCRLHPAYGTGFPCRMTGRALLICTMNFLGRLLKRQAPMLKGKVTGGNKSPAGGTVEHEEQQTDRAGDHCFRKQAAFGPQIKMRLTGSWGMTATSIRPGPLFTGTAPFLAPCADVVRLLAGVQGRLATRGGAAFSFSIWTIATRLTIA